MCYEGILLLISPFIHFVFAFILCNFTPTLPFHLEIMQWKEKSASASRYASVTINSNISSKKETRNPSKHAETEGSRLLLLMLTSAENDTQFHLCGVSGRE